MKKKEIEKLKTLEDRARKLHWKITALKEREVNENALPELRKMIGKCFKYLNSYGSSLPQWWLYTKIISIDEKNLSFICVQFQRTSLEKVEIELRRSFNWGGKHHFDGNNYIEIPASEYNRAKKQMKNFLIEKLEL